MGGGEGKVALRRWSPSFSFFKHLVSRARRSESPLYRDIWTRGTNCNHVSPKAVLCSISGSAIYTTVRRELPTSRAGLTIFGKLVEISLEGHFHTIPGQLILKRSILEPLEFLLVNGGGEGDCEFTCRCTGTERLISTVQQPIQSNPHALWQRVQKASYIWKLGKAHRWGLCRLCLGENDAVERDRAVGKDKKHGWMPACKLGMQTAQMSYANDTDMNNAK